MSKMCHKLMHLQMGSNPESLQLGNIAMAAKESCLSGFEWDGTPVGKEGKLGTNDSYIVGDNEDVAILVIADLFGWTFINERLLCDHYAKEADATVYMPDLYYLSPSSPHHMTLTSK